MKPSVHEVLAEMATLPEFTGISPLNAQSRDSLGSTPLHIAAVRGDLAAIAALLDAGADINARGEHGYTPLHEAVEQEQIAAVKLLLERGASVQITNKDDYTPAELAALFQNPSLEALFQ